jgi:hypothetical protein
VKGWTGVTKVEAVSGETALNSSGEGRILINGDTKDKSIPCLKTAAEWNAIR